jgi:hypothetical protein
MDVMRSTATDCTADGSAPRLGAHRGSVAARSRHLCASFHVSLIFVSSRSAPPGAPLHSTPLHAGGRVMPPAAAAAAAPLLRTPFLCVLWVRGGLRARLRYENRTRICLLSAYRI